MGLAYAFRDTLNKDLRAVTGAKDREARAAQDAASQQPPGWVAFATNDPDSQTLTRTARVIEDPPAPPPGQAAPADPGPASALELRASGLDERHAKVELRPATPDQCLQISTVSFRFDTAEPQTFPVLGSMLGDACVLEVTGFKRFLDGVRYATTTIAVIGPLAPGGKPRILRFHTLGLVWSPD